jgi:hypothetical protein
MVQAKLLRLARNGDLDAARAAKQPDGQITKNLSRPGSKNIPLNASGKSALSARPVSPDEGRLAIVTNAR